MELRSRASAMLRPPVPVTMPIASKSCDRLMRLESRVVSHRQLRGIMCLLAILCSCLTMFQVENYAVTVILHVLVLLLSLGGEVCLYFIFHIKAEFSGLTNPADRTTRAVSVMHSPHTTRMFVEMVVWILQAPPGLRAESSWTYALDSLLFLRYYVFILFFSQLASYPVFKRAIGTLCGIRFDSLYYFRETILTRHAPLTMLAFVIAWLIVGLLYSKGESIGYGDALYFCMTTSSFVAFGDFSPVTFTGRFAAVLSWCLGLSVLAWCVGIMFDLLQVSGPERHMYTLFRTNKLCAQVPGEAARTIQRAWKLYYAKKEKRNALSIQFNAYLLTQQAASFRVLRRTFAAEETAFIRSTYTFEDAVTAMVSPGTTPTSSPTLTPRRPFSLFRTLKTKINSPGTSSADLTAMGSAKAQTDSSSARPRTTGKPGPIKLPANRSSLSVLDSHGRTQSPPPTFSANTAAALAEMDGHIQRIDDVLEQLIRKTQRLGLIHGTGSPTEVDS